MANHKSAEKRIRSDKRKNIVNKTYLSSIRTLIKKFKILSKNKDNIGKLNDIFKNIQSKLAKSANKNMMHKKKASRIISRLSGVLDLSNKN